MISASDQPKNYFDRLSEVINQLDTKKISELISKIAFFSKTDKTLFIAGNGGSAAAASHMSCDFGKTILSGDSASDRYWLRVTSLVDNVPLMTALANDFGYDKIFSEQLKGLGRQGDMLIVISASGNSINILELLKIAKAMGLHTYGLLGFDGGKAKDLVDDMIIVPSQDYGLVEDAHMIVNHLITDWFRNQNIRQ